MPQPPAIASSEATAELGQDLERVLSTETQGTEAQGAETQAAKPASASDTPISPEVTSPEAVKLSEPESPALPSSAPLPPKLNWQSKGTAESEAEAAPAEADAITPVEPLVPAASPQSEPEVLFTEPSPWGNPLNEKAAIPSLEEAVAAETAVAS